MKIKIKISKKKILVIDYKLVAILVFGIAFTSLWLFYSYTNTIPSRISMKDMTPSEDNTTIEKQEEDSKEEQPESVIAPESKPQPTPKAKDIPPAVKSASGTFNVSECARSLSSKYGIKYSILMGLMETESGFNPNAISGTNDYGICQINSINHPWLIEKLQLTNIMDPSQNMECGAYMLSSLYSRFPDYTDHMILMAYNMGPTGSKKLFEQGIYSSQYSNKVINNASKYEQAHEDVIVNYHK